MTKPVKRYEFFVYIYDDVAELDCHETDDGTWINAADYASLEQECERLRNALEKIAAIEDRYNCGDWDEIEEAREIATAALSAKP